MIHWGWTVIAFFAGFVTGLFVLAFAEVSRREEKGKKWWKDD